ncbi:MAG: DoxX family membrane protein [Planctomycetota bacterium]
MKRKEKPNAANYIVVFLRLLLGALLLVDGVHAVRELLPEPKLLVETLEAQVEGAPFPFSLVGNFAIDAPETASTLMRYATLFCGLALLFGALVRPAGALIATGHLCAFFLSAPADQHYHLLAAGVAASCAIGSAGRVLGLDASLDAILPTWMTWAGKHADTGGEQMFM